MQILMAGDIVGGPGRRCLARVVAEMRRERRVDFVIANGENAAGGQGLTPRLAEELLAAGVDVLTLGDHAWDQKELGPFLDRAERVLRPANFAPGCPGRGFCGFDTPEGRVTVGNLVGRVFMPAQDCPFRAADEFLRRAGDIGRAVLVDFHAEATSEKIAMGRYLDGRVTCVAGTHTHVQTSDEVILPKGTAYITDLGMTGPRESVLGRDIQAVTSRFLTGIPCRFEVPDGEAVLEGVIVDVDMKSGKARGIRRIRQRE